VKESSGQAGFKKDKQGEIVISKLDEVALEKIALATNGKYYRASSGEEELDKIYEDVMGMEKKELGTLRFSQFEDRFQYLLVMALLLLVIEFFLPERREITREWKGRFEKEAVQ
jgi:Ca-activated chloride channel family protein